MKKNLNILIPNGTSPRNLGDKALLEGMISLINKIANNPIIWVHTTDPHLYSIKDRFEFRLKSNITSWALFSNKKFSSKVLRILQLCVLLFGLKRQVQISVIPVNHELKKIIRNYIDADIVFFTGGGYLRSKKGVKQTLNLLMQCYPFMIASYLKKKIIVGPISFGPFGYKWQEKVVAQVLKTADIVAVREEISFKLLEAHGLSNSILTSDFAFFLEKSFQTKKKNKKFMIGLTIRNWFSETAQLQFENEIIESIKKVAEKKDIIVQPIIQVNAPMYGDFDAKIAHRMAEKLKKEKIKVAAIAAPTSVKEALQIYKKIDMLIGMRMHSNILAGISGTPFVGISYEHKTEGIAKQLGIDKYCIKSSELKRSILIKNIMNAYERKKQISKDMSQKISLIKRNESKKWRNIFHEIV